MCPTLTWSQSAVARREPDDLAHPGETLVLHEDEDGGDLVGEHVGVGRGRQPLARHRHDVQTVGKLVEEVGVAWKVGGRGQNN